PVGAWLARDGVSAGGSLMADTLRSSTLMPPNETIVGDQHTANSNKRSCAYTPATENRLSTPRLPQISAKQGQKITAFGRCGVGVHYAGNYL
ncbi:MAG: hypothetical protein M3Q94_02145, partial [Pseudomonadota bacterium]|nr:hypothetical protein [Pseudomonadota bacterium]